MAPKRSLGGPLQTVDAERWRQVKSALADALALSGPARAAYLERVGARDPALRAEVESQLAAEREGGSRFLESPAAAAAQPLRQPNRLAGRRLGQYELLEEIGTGGMGDVYRAVRVDGEYEHQVAIKLVRAGVDAEFVGQRLRTERQILAAFEHPNIARLLDGGTTEDGVPYLVMELIAGEPIDRYCERQQLDIAARLRLFLPVCAAVQYAHQRAVIHRDLKPRNILVTADGVPKLLDFGIAKILEPGPIAARTDVTINAGRMILTPEYASPEQLKGELISAASDVYALGVILYELLTGAKPFRVSDRVTEDGQVLRPVASEPTKPSTAARRRGESASSPPGSPDGLSRRLRGDLDNIVLMALHHEPERRYATVERLADDIRRHLEHRPVSARRPTLRYRASVFVARHTAGVVAAALVFLALAVGYVATLREAHIANEQRALAQRRFDDVRRLADSLIFDIHDSIRDLPGAAPSRRLLIRTALQYLDGLSRDAKGDPGLERDLAAAYLRTGDLQGQALSANEGDYAAALHSYRQALALWQASLLAQPANTAARLNLVQTYGKLSDLTWTMGDPAAALAYSRQTVTQSRLLASRHPNDRRYQILTAISALDSGYKLYKIRGDRAGSLQLVRQATEELQSLSAAAPQDLLTARRLALAEERQAEILTASGDDPAALSLDQSALRILQTLSAAQPQNTDFLDLQAFAEFDLADQLDRMRRFGEAERFGAAARENFRSLSAADPGIGQYHIGAGRTLIVMAKTALDEGQPAQARPLLEQSLGELSQAAPTQRGSADFQFATAAAESLLGDVFQTLATGVTDSRLERLRDWQSARQWFVRAVGAFPVGFADATAQANADKAQILRCDQEIARAVGRPSSQRPAPSGHTPRRPTTRSTSGQP
jgi:non-specific serine/threonine protein kinase/serine/threonine-protein kinase